MTRLKTLIPIKYMYILHGIELESVSSAMYLGATISEDLSWRTNLNNTSKKANQTLRFVSIDKIEAGLFRARADSVDQLVVDRFDRIEGSYSELKS